MTELEQAITGHPFFAGLAPEHLACIVDCGRLASFAAGSYLFRAGTRAEHFFLVREGTISLELAPPGRDAFRFQTVGPGQAAGWSWLLAPHDWQFDARAVDDVGVVQFDGRRLRERLEADPRLGYDLVKRFAQLLAQRFYDTRLQLLDVYGKGRD